jgi:hypothetical protein
VNFLKILELILGTAEGIVPVFVHNTQSQKIEAVILTSVNGLLEALAAQASAPAPAPTPAK